MIQEGLPPAVTQKEPKQLPWDIISSFRRYKEYYTEKELNHVEDFLQFFTTQRFENFIEICRHVQEFIFISKYNLKRNSMSNMKTITFVCSCISKKEIKFISKENDNTGEETTPMSSKQQSRKVKRKNVDACRFRLKMKWDRKMGKFILHSKSNFEHNHPPQENLSVEEFKSLSRNIKFPLDSIIQIIDLIVREISTYKIIDSRFLKELRSKILKEYFPEVEDKILKGTISKKLYYFIDMIRKLALKNYREDWNKTLVNRVIIKHILSKNAATYLRQDCLQILYNAYHKKS